MQFEHTKASGKEVRRVLGEPLPIDTVGRYDRVKAVQKTGETTRDMWHKADWDKVKENPESVQFPREDWIHTFDAEKHAEEVFDKNFQQVQASVNGNS